MHDVPISFFCRKKSNMLINWEIEGRNPVSTCKQAFNISIIDALNNADALGNGISFGNLYDPAVAARVEKP